MNNKMISGMAGLLLLGMVATVQAQDTTRTSPTTKPKVGTQQPQPQQPQQDKTQSPQTPTNQYRRDDMKVMQQDQLPESLRQTLRGTQYQGWEQSTIYQDPATGEYLMDMTPPATNPNNPNPNDNQNSSTKTTPARTYRFDQHGKVIQDQNKSGGNR